VTPMETIQWLIPTVFGLGAVSGFGLGFIIRALISRRRRRVATAVWNDAATNLRFIPPGGQAHPHAEAA